MFCWGWCLTLFSHGLVFCAGGGLYGFWLLFDVLWLVVGEPFFSPLI